MERQERERGRLLSTATHSLLYTLNPKKNVVGSSAVASCVCL
jgi:hypothetical protein